MRAVLLATTVAAPAADALFLGRSKKQGPLSDSVWDVMRVGTDLPKVIEEYKNTLQSGELKADGFLPTGCFPDLNLKTRDKHGSATSYEGPISVIKYEDVVSGPQQQPMSQQVCFEFCRRHDGVKFFGLTNGSKCYCSPMFVVGTQGKAGCKTPCEGNGGQMCGGPDSSSIFEMHNSPPAERFNDTDMIAFNDLRAAVANEGTAAKDCIDNLVKSGSELVGSQKQKGNTVSMKHQEAMTSSYQSILADLNALPFRSADVAGALETALGAYSSLGPDAAEAALEKAMAEVQAGADAAAASLPQVTAVLEQCAPKLNATGDISFYQPISEASSSACDGKVIGPVSLVGTDTPQDLCAQKCTNTMAPDACTGFQVYTGLVAGVQEAVCMLFSEISGLTNYIKEGCATAAPRSGKCFVQKTEIANHELAVKTDTAVLDYCFEAL